MIVFGDHGLDEGHAYDPLTNSWQAISAPGAPSARQNHTAVWTGSRMIVFGGTTDDGYGSDGASYDPVTNTWAPISTLDAPSGRTQHTAVWADNKMIVWGGYGDDGLLNTGASYDPATNTWTPLAQVNPPAARRLHAASWANGRMYVIGGTNYVTYYVGTSNNDDFARSIPPTAFGRRSRTRTRRAIASRITRSQRARSSSCGAGSAAHIPPTAVRSTTWPRGRGRR